MQNRTPGSKVANLYVIYFSSFCPFISHFTPSPPPPPPLHFIVSFPPSFHPELLSLPTHLHLAAPLLCAASKEVAHTVEG